MFLPQSILIKKLKVKIPQLLRNRELMFRILPKAVALGTMPANMLNHTLSHRQPKLAMSIRILLGEHVHKPHMRLLVPRDQIPRFLPRENKALRAAALLVRDVDASGERQHARLAGGENEHDRQRHRYETYGER
jgi:hypothetical protein